MSRSAGDFTFLNEQVERALIPPIQNRAQIHPPKALLVPRILQRALVHPEERCLLANRLPTVNEKCLQCGRQRNKPVFFSWGA